MLKQLDGNWEFQRKKIDKGEVIKNSEPSGRWHRASCPGGVHLDMLRNGLISEPLAGMGSLASRRLEDSLWFYRKVFKLKKEDKGKISRLFFEGLDCIAEIYLNGRHIGRTENAFTEHSFDAALHLKAGMNVLLVKMTNGLETVRRKDVKKYAGGGRYGSRIFLRKPQFSFGWDWAPRLVTCGIWKNVYIESSDTGFIDNLHVESSPDRKFQSADVKASFVFSPAPGQGKIPAELQVSHSGKTVFSEKIMVRPGLNRRKLKITSPALWFPRGEGPANLYSLEVSSPETEMKKSTRFGIRKVSLIERPVREGGKTCCFMINGRRVFAKGANWVPADSIIGRPGDSKTQKLLDEAAKCNFNMLRVWGGGIYESDRFYDLCDELGIMVWQDFMYACALYPDDDESFLANCTLEAEKVVRRLRNHPSIVMWCGNNEIHDAYQDVFSFEADRFYGERIWDHILPEVVQKLSPGSMYRPASPYGGSFHRSGMEGDSHNLMTGLTRDERLDTRSGVEAVGRMMTEFYTWNSPPPIKSMRQYLPADKISPLSREYRHHANELYDTRELAVVKKYITGFPDKIPAEIYIGALQRLHGEHMALMVNSYRRNIHVCSGALFWMYNDCWPTSGWTTHDYYTRRKALYYYMKRAFAPLSVSFKEEEGGLSVWISNLTAGEFFGTLEAGIYCFSGFEPKTHFKKEIRLKPYRAFNAGFFYADLSWPWEMLKSFAHAALRDIEGGIIASSSKLFSSYKGMSGSEFVFPACFWEKQSIQKPSVILMKEGKRKLRIQTDSPVFSLGIEADDYFPEDNYFDIMPGEKKIVGFERDIPARLKTTSLNDIIIHLRKNTAGGAAD